MRATAINPFVRSRIEDEINLHLDRVTALLARLDRMDGDCDLEDDDPAGDPLDECGEAPADDGSKLLRMFPIYGIDQRRGPTNIRRARNAYRQDLMEGGR